MGDNQRLAFSLWLAHPRCAMESPEGSEDRGCDRFGVAFREATGASAPSENVPPCGNISEDLTAVNDRGNWWGAHR